MDWQKQYAEYESGLLRELGFCLVWISSDLIKQLDEWYRIPIPCIDTFRAVLKKEWEQNGEFCQLHSTSQVQSFLQKLESANQNPEQLWNWFLETQLTSGSLGSNMTAWTEALTRCSAGKQLQKISSKVDSLMSEYVWSPYSAFHEATDELSLRWMESPAHRSAWDEYLYEIYYKELAEAPPAIADEEVRLRLFRQFWRKVELEMSSDEISKFEQALAGWSEVNVSSDLKIDLNIDISTSIGV